MTEQDQIVAQLRRNRFWDGGQLTDEQAADLDAQVHDSPGLHVVLLPPGTIPQPYRTIGEDLGLDPTDDLLLLSGAGRWEARGWGLAPEVISQVLDDAEPALATGVALGVEAAIRGLRRAVPGVWSEPLGGLAIGAAGLATLAGMSGLGFLIWRRNRVAEVE